MSGDLYYKQNIVKRDTIFIILTEYGESLLHADSGSIQTERKRSLLR